MKRTIAFLLTLVLLLSACFCRAEGIAITEYVDVNGVKCKEKQNILTYLFMGIDTDGPVQRRLTYDGEGQCDFLMLLIIDKAADTYALLHIDRDTVTPVHTLARDTGEDLGAYPTQICLAHAQGTGLQDSCENAATAVSDLLLGVKVDHYMAVNLDAITIINRSVGGVEVTIQDDFSQTRDDMPIGETIRLDDSQVISFVRGRMSVADGTNENRMRRQRQYLDAIRPLLEQRATEDPAYPLNLVHSLGLYTVTDMKDSDISYIAKALLKNKDLGTFALEGSMATDKMGFNAFYPDEQALTDLVIDLFYYRQ